MKEKEAGRFKSTDIDSAIKSEAYIKSVYKIQFFFHLYLIAGEVDDVGRELALS